MEHLTAETLARLVDDDASAEERTHLEGCARCSEELRAYEEQTWALGSLPELLPPKGDWAVLEARLRSEGLVHDPGLFARFGLTRTPAWMRVAASVLIFGVGALSGAAWASPAPVVSGEDPDGAVVQVADADDLEGAASAVRQAERRYVDAMGRYRELLAASGEDVRGADPFSRYAALEHLVQVSQAAVRQAPGDPFLNGFLASALAEREAAARLVSSERDSWF